MKASHVLGTLMLLTSVCFAGTEGRDERYAVPYFDGLIMKATGHPSYEFILMKSENKGAGLYYISLDYKLLPQEITVTALMRTMITYVASNYPPREIMGMVFLNGEAASIIDGDSSLFYSPVTKQILTSKQKHEHTEKTTDQGDYTVKVEKEKDSFKRDMVDLTFNIKTDLDENPDAVVNVMLTRLVQEIKQAQGQVGICHARGRDRSGKAIDGAFIEYSPEKGALSRIWFRTSSHNVKVERIGLLSDYK